MDIIFNIQTKKINCIRTGGKKELNLVLIY